MKIRLKPGQKAPQFEVKDVLGNLVNLEKCNGRSTLVVFLRYSGCPWCNLVIDRLTLDYPLLKKDKCRLVVFVQSDKERIIKNIYGRHTTTPPYPIIADPGMKTYKKFGVSLSVTAVVRSALHLPSWVQSVYSLGYKQKKIDGNFFLVPAMFLIDEKQTVARAYYGSSFYDHEVFINIHEWLNFRD